MSIFSATAQKQLIEQQTRYPFLERFIRQVLAQDQRPAYKKSEADEKIYAAHLLDFNVILNVLQDASTYPAEDTNSKPLSRSCRAS